MEVLHRDLRTRLDAQLPQYRSRPEMSQIDIGKCPHSGVLELDGRVLGAVAPFAVTADGHRRSSPVDFERPASPATLEKSCHIEHRKRRRRHPC